MAEKELKPDFKAEYAKSNRSSVKKKQPPIFVILITLG